MNKYFVLYSDGYPEDGDHSWKEFDNLEQATAFIEDRLARSRKPDITEYSIISGKKLTFVAWETVTKIKVEE